MVVLLGIFICLKKLGSHLNNYVATICVASYKDEAVFGSHLYMCKWLFDPGIAITIDTSMGYPAGLNLKFLAIHLTSYEQNTINCCSL